MKNFTDVVVEAAEVVGRRVADMKNPTDTVVEVAAVVRRQAAEVIVTDVVPDHQAAAAKHQRKEESSLVKQLERILLCLLFSSSILESIFCCFRKDNQIV